MLNGKKIPIYIFCKKSIELICLSSTLMQNFKMCLKHAKIRNFPNYNALKNGEVRRKFA